MNKKFLLVVFFLCLLPAFVTADLVLLEHVFEEATDTISDGEYQHVVRLYEKVLDINPDYFTEAKKCFSSR